MLSIPDNDQISAQISQVIDADLLILLSDVDGIYSSHPSEPGARVISTYYPEHAVQVKFWGKSRVGKGGMESKVGLLGLRYRMHSKGVYHTDYCIQLKSASEAVEGGTAVVIANGVRQRDTILDIVRGKTVGTFVTKNGHNELATPVDALVEEGMQSKQVVLAVDIKYASVSPQHAVVAMPSSPSAHSRYDTRWCANVHVV